MGITGANGYVGSRIAGGLERAGFRVVALVREPRADSDERRFTLDAAISDDLLTGLDVLVHCAWDMRVASRDEMRRINIEGSERLIEAADRAGIGRVIFISSMSAFAGCKSRYGQAKLQVEARLRQSEHAVVIRPGLIYGDDPGGIVGVMTALGRKTPVLPMIGLGRYKLHTCHEDDLADLVVACCDPQITRFEAGAPVTAAESTGREFRDIVRTLARRDLVFVPIPWRLAWLALRVLEAVGIRTRLKSDSLVGLVNSDPAPDFASRTRLGVHFRSLVAESDPGD